METPQIPHAADLAKMVVARDDSVDAAKVNGIVHSLKEWVKEATISYRRNGVVYAFGVPAKLSHAEQDLFVAQGYECKRRENGTVEVTVPKALLEKHADRVLGSS